MTARQLLKKIVAKHNIQKSHIHIFHNRLLGEVGFNQNSVGADVVIREKVTLTENSGMKTSTK